MIIEPNSDAVLAAIRHAYMLARGAGGVDLELRLNKTAYKLLSIHRDGLANWSRDHEGRDTFMAMTIVFELPPLPARPLDQPDIRSIDNEPPTVCVGARCELGRWRYFDGAPSAPAADILSDEELTAHIDAITTEFSDPPSIEDGAQPGGK